jgi:hypothetical protein
LRCYWFEDCIAPFIVIASPHKNFFRQEEMTVVAAFVCPAVRTGDAEKKQRVRKICARAAPTKAATPVIFPCLNFFYWGSQ